MGELRSHGISTQTVCVGGRLRQVRLKANRSKKNHQKIEKPHCLEGPLLARIRVERNSVTLCGLMKVIGITGGIASGKSLVTQYLASYGATVLDADSAGHQVLRDPEVKRAIRERWGSEVFQDDTSSAEIDRPAVARIVFARTPLATRERKFLESLTHPRIRLFLFDQIAQFRQQGSSAAVLDAPLLFEAGWDEVCDWLLFVDAPHQQRLAAAVARGWSEDEFAARENSQLTVDEKRVRCDRVLDNSGTKEELLQQVRQFWRSEIEGALDSEDASEADSG